MRLKWLRLGVAAALIGTSAHAEWQYEWSEMPNTAYTAYSFDGADWFVVIRDAQAISFQSEVNGSDHWSILYLHPDGSVWACYFTGVANDYSYCLVND